MADWSKERGVADEIHIDQFIATVGGERVDQRFPNAAFPNADYIFANEKVLIELKVLETEFGDTDALKAREARLMREVAQKFSVGAILRGESKFKRYWAEARWNHYRVPLGRITEKANRQLRETKAALGEDGYRGLLWLVNDNFRGIGTDLALGLLLSTVGHRNPHVDGLVYVTNHYVDFPGDDFARLVWAPAYAEGVSQDLVDFVDRLGAAWFQFQEGVIGQMDDRQSGPDISLRGARPIV
ncbi:hypothetical protein [uncultured Brevundimonas sp.]|uniref:hypothetical protein n=1 Tax=uncultured Brevundimonas sp. TaxID=213418 RepID=UPI0030ECAAC9|tara:strand:+ start:799 stop:1524 length:726 start_codon:yes stop_codon:yes gene_type:complete